MKIYLYINTFCLSIYHICNWIFLFYVFKIYKWKWFFPPKNLRDSNGIWIPFIWQPHTPWNGILNSNSVGICDPKNDGKFKWPPFHQLSSPQPRCTWRGEVLVPLVQKINRWDCPQNRAFFPFPEELQPWTRKAT